jgi:hypothetical protein
MGGGDAGEEYETAALTSNDSMKGCLFALECAEKRGGSCMLQPCLAMKVNAMISV